MAHVLFVVTSYDRLLNGDPTGLWLEEFAVPYNKVREAGHEATVVSVSGGDVALDPASRPDETQAASWRDAVDVLRATPSLASVRATDYDAVFIPGGHGTVFDMPYNKALHDLLFTIDDAGGTLVSVCHGPGVFVGMRRADGTPYVQGKRIACFTDAEETAVGGTQKVPFLLESRLYELGADPQPAPDWTVQVVHDGRLITGQNPQSSGAVADALLENLESPATASG